VPRLDEADATSPGNNDDYLLEADFSVDEGYVHGRGYSSDIRYTKAHAGDVDSFFADEDNWNLFESGSHFEAFDCVLNDPGRDQTFIPPEVGDYWVVFSNKASMDMAHVIRGSVSLYRNTGAVPGVEHLLVDKNEAGSSLLDWEDVVGHNVDGYNVYRSLSAADVGAGRTQSELDPFLLATVSASAYTDDDAAVAGECFFYSVRTRSKRGGISP